MTEYRSDLFFGACTGNGRILVVDDERSIRIAVRRMLEKAGYDVLEAENGETAIEAINTGENRLMLDAVICDIRMPKINGLEALAYF
jgi:two-component system, chemotaxis family, chemotaxis protein CheY